MSDDTKALVERLRIADSEDAHLYDSAADTIERLERDRDAIAERCEKLRAILDAKIGAAIPPRKPTKAMSDAGLETVFKYTMGSNHLIAGGVEAAWRAMYDAALTEKEWK